jgi:hypothetical protein
MAGASGAGLATAHARWTTREALAHGVHELIGHDWLAQHARHVEPDGVLGRCGRHDHDRDVSQLPSGSDLLLNYEAADRRQEQIEHDEIGTLSLEEVQRAHAVACLFDVEAGDEERRAEDAAEILMVFDDEDRVRTGHRATSYGRGDVTAKRNRKLNA